MYVILLTPTKLSIVTEGGGEEADAYGRPAGRPAQVRDRAGAEDAGGAA